MVLRMARESRTGLLSYSAINDNIVRIATRITTSRTLLPCFSALSNRCERRSRLLLVVKTNRKLEVSRHSNLLLCIADFKYGGLMFRERAIFCK